MATFCPHCDDEIENQIQQDWVGDYLEHFDYECPKCGREMKIDVESEPIFYAHKKDNQEIQERKSRLSRSL
jgi:Zn ribbon nucleic-acid-binding protein